jgi:hypothetical protein
LSFDPFGKQIDLANVVDMPDSVVGSDSFYMYGNDTLSNMDPTQLASHYGSAIRRLGRQHPYTTQVASALGKKTYKPPMGGGTPLGSAAKAAPELY